MNARSTPRTLETRLGRLALPFLLGIGLSGCGLFSSGQTHTLRAHPSVPASTAELNTSEDDNGNIKLELSVEHLALPAKVAPDATVYIVWVQPGSETIQNVGALKVNDDLEAELVSLTPYRRFGLSLTPEPSARVSKPTHEAVFTIDVDLGD
jgi:hypothetical protein